MSSEAKPEPDPAPRPFRVLKFGGTSVGSAERIEAVVDIVADQLDEARLAVVVSAVGGTTDELVRAAALAAEGDPGHIALVDDLRDRHVHMARALAAADEADEVVARIERWSAELREVLQGASLVRETSPRTRDWVMSFGELMSSFLVAAALRRAGIEARACDARDVVVTDEAFGAARVDLQATEARARAIIGGDAALQVVTGFIAATTRRETTTLGRGGSDYTAALLGAMLGADRVEIWTDVSGVMSADPRLVEDAFAVASLSYEELMELSHFGARVVHTPSVHPARAKGIPLRIRNSFEPSFEGTRVGGEVRTGAGAARGIASVDDVALLRLEGDGMIGVPGVAQRLFGALAANDISVVLITQASSEHSICFAVDPGRQGEARRCVEAEFEIERRVGLVDELVVEDGLSIVAVVGEGMRNTAGIAGRVFSVLGDAGINVHAIAQGSSELNISVVVSSEHERRAVRALHAALFARATHRTFDLYLAGVGQVGGRLLAQLAAERGRLLIERGVDLRVAGVASSRTAALDPEGLDPAGWRAALDRAEAPADRLVDALLDRGGSPHRILVDCTASDAVADRYAEALRSGASVVAANKRAFSGTLARWVELRGAARPGALIRHETTVGSALPVLRSIEDLVATGDEIVSVEGVLSGSLASVFTAVRDGAALSEAVSAAREAGFTEPDPRDDLSGMDVARKLLIAGRLAGFPLEPEAVSVESVLPDGSWLEGGVESFMSRLPELDEGFEARRAAASGAGRRLCYLGRVARDGARVGITEIADDHPCWSLAGTDNLVAIETRRNATPVVIRGPGAGPDVTAAGVFVDILRVVEETR